MKYFISIILTLSFCSCGLISTEHYPSLKQYYQAGIPLVEKDWTSQEYLTAIQILINDQELELPNQENNSIKIIEKITNIDEINSLKTSDFDNEEEYLIYLDHLINDLIHLNSIYGNNINTKKGKLKYSNETIFIVVATFYLIDIQMQSTLVKNASKEQLKRSQKMMEKVVKYGLEGIQNSYIFYQEKDVCLYSKTLFEFYQKNKNYISKEAQEEFDHQIATMKYSHRRQCVKEYAKEIFVKK